VVGFIGSLQAVESIKLLVGMGTSLVGRVLRYGPVDMSVREVPVARKPACPACKAVGGDD